MIQATPITSPAQWHRLRKEHVGASEVGAVFDVHPFLTRFELWHQKKGTFEEERASENERVFWGQTLEEGIARGVGEKTGWTMRKARRYLSAGRLGATLDYEAHRQDGGWGVVQIKNIDWLEFAKWDDGAPPLHYELQVQQELFLSRHSWATLAVLVGGNSLKTFDRAPHHEAWRKIERGVAEFWPTIERGEEPKPDFQRDAETVARVRAWAKKGKVAFALDNAEMNRAMWDYYTARAEEKDARQRALELKARILHQMGDAAVLVSDDWRAVTEFRPSIEVQRYTRRAFRDFEVKRREGLGRKPAPSR